MRYGDPFLLAQSYLKKLDTWPAIHADDVKKLKEYTTLLVGCCNAMTSTDCIHQLDYPSSLQLVVSKLPIYLQDKWSRVADRILHEEHTSLSLTRVVEFMEHESRIALNPMFGRSARQSGGSNKFKPKSGSQAKNTSSKNALTVSATTVIPASNASFKALAPPCLHCEGQHTLQACRKFRKILHEDKVSLLMKNRLCFYCLGTGHRRAECSKKAVCDVCKGSHPTALHRVPIVSRSSASAPLTSVSSVSAASTTAVTVSAIGSDLKGSCDTMPIIPVMIKLRNSDNEIATYAFLDTGSSDTIITEQLMAQLNARGQRTNVNITTLHGCDVPTSCVAVSGLEVCGYGEGPYISLPTVYTQPSLPVTKDQIATQEDFSCWPLSVRLYDSCAGCGHRHFDWRQCMEYYGTLEDCEFHRRWTISSVHTAQVGRQWSSTWRLPV